MWEWWRSAAASTVASVTRSATTTFFGLMRGAGEGAVVVAMVVLVLLLFAAASAVVLVVHVEFGCSADCQSEFVNQPQGWQNATQAWRLCGMGSRWKVPIGLMMLHFGLASLLYFFLVWPSYNSQTIRSGAASSCLKYVRCPQWKLPITNVMDV